MADIVVPESLLDATDELRKQERIAAHLDDFARQSAPPPPPAEPAPNPFSGAMADQLLAPFRARADQARGMAQQAQEGVTSAFDALLSPFTQRANEQRQREQAAASPSPYNGALTTLGGTPEAEALTQRGGTAYTGEAPSGEMRYGAIDHSSRDAFVRSMAPYAVEAEKATGIPASIMLAINLNEQGWQNPAPGNNYFGIKGSNPRTGANTGPVSTWEDYGTGRVNIQDTFRAYGSPAESYADFAQFLKDNPRYHGALQILQQTGDPSAFIKAVHRAGYATDPAWSDKILNIAQGVAPYVGQAQQTISQAPQSAPAPAPMGTIKGGISVSDAMAADRGRSMAFQMPYASDESGIVYPGDEPLLGGMNGAGTADVRRADASVRTGTAGVLPQADAYDGGSGGVASEGQGIGSESIVNQEANGAYYSSPEGTSLAPQPTAPPSQPSDAVEPASSVPASLGDRIRSTFEEFGSKLGDLLGGANSAAVGGLNQGARTASDVWQAGAEKPSLSRRVVDATVVPMAQDIVGGLNESRIGYQNALSDATGGVIPEGSSERDANGYRVARPQAIQFAENWMAPTSAVPEVRGLADTSEEALRRLRAQQGRAAMPSPSIGIVGQADDAGRAAAELPYSASRRYGVQTLYHETGPSNVSSFVHGDASIMEGRWVSPDPDLALGQGSNKGVLIEFGNTSQIEVRAERGKPGVRMLDDGTGAPPSEMTVLKPPHGNTDLYVKSITVKPDVGIDVVARRRLRSSGWIPEVLEDGSVRFDNPRFVDAPAGTPGGLLPGTTPQLGTATRIGGQALGSSVGAAYQESQREGSTPESIAQAGLGAAATSLGGQALRRGLGAPQAGRILRAVEQAGESDDIIHIRRQGYLRQSGPEAERILTDVAAKGDRFAPQSFEDIEAYARTVIDPKKAAKWAGEMDSRDLAATVEAVRQGVAAEVAQLRRSLRGADAMRSWESLDMANELMESAINAATGSAYLKAGPNLATAVGRALNQHKHAIQFSQAEAYLASMQQVVKGIESRLPTLDTLRKGRTPKAKQLGELSSLGDELENPARIRRITGEGDEGTMLARTIRSAGEAGAKKQADADVLELVKTNRAWLDAQDAGNLAKVEELSATRDDLLTKIRARYEASMPPKPPRTPEMPEPEDLLAMADAQAARDIARRMRTDVIDAMGLTNKNLDATAAARQAREEIDAAVAALVGRGDPDGVQREMGAALDKTFGAALENAAKHARNREERYTLNELGQKARERIGGIFAAAGDTERQVDLHQEFQAILGQLRDVSPRGRTLADSLLRAYDTRTQNAIDRASRAMARGAQTDIDKLMREIDAQHVRETAASIRELVQLARQSPDDSNIAAMAETLFTRLEQYGELGKKRQADLKRSLVETGLERMIGKVDPEQARGFLVALASVDPDRPETLANVLRGMRDASTPEMFIELGIANMLTGPPTHAVNLTSNIAQGTGRYLVELPVMTLYDTTLGRGRAGLRWGDLPETYHALWNARGAGLEAAGQIMRTGNTRAGYETAAVLGDFGGVRRELLTERFGAPAAALHAISTRPLAASDQVLSSMFEAAEMQRLAMMRARETGTTPEAILSNLVDHVDMVKQAKKNANYQLLKEKSVINAALGGAVSKVGGPDSLGGRALTLGAHVAMPFTTTPENVAKQGASITPVVGTAYNALRFARETNPEEKARRFSKMIGGVAMLGIAETLLANGALTGEGPEDAEKRAEMTAKGWQPRSLRVGNQYISYDGTPWAIPFAVIATAHERTAEELAKGKVKSAPDLVGTVVSSGLTGGVGAFAHQTFVRNLGEIYDTVTGAPTGGSFDSLIGGQVGRLVYAGSLLAYLGRLFDGMQRETRMVDPVKIGGMEIPGSNSRTITSMLERTPFARNLLPERQDVLGRPMENEQRAPYGLAILPTTRRSTIKDDPIIQAFLNAGVDLPSKPPEELSHENLAKGVRVPITAKERREYQRFFGEQVARLMEGSKWPTKADDLEKIRNLANERATNHILSPMGMAEIRRRATRTPTGRS